ncbi:MAG TPA: hypothetical protein VM913_03225 [Sphingomicrobium sp.]|jgi:hypothetical protein|nr:hypothetical protein [Sphingomicrobium sp.]
MIAPLAMENADVASQLRDILFSNRLHWASPLLHDAQIVSWFSCEQPCRTQQVTKRSDWSIHSAILISSRRPTCTIGVLFEQSTSSELPCGGVRTTSLSSSGSSYPGVFGSIVAEPFFQFLDVRSRFVTAALHAIITPNTVASFTC